MQPEVYQELEEYTEDTVGFDVLTWLKFRYVAEKT
jgi:hypothetical protein